MVGHVFIYQKFTQEKEKEKAEKKERAGPDLARIPRPTTFDAGQSKIASHIS